MVPLVMSFWLPGSTMLLPARVVKNLRYLSETLRHLLMHGHTFRHFTTQFGLVDDFAPFTSWNASSLNDHGLSY